MEGRRRREGGREGGEDSSREEIADVFKFLVGYPPHGWDGPLLELGRSSPYYILH